MATSVATPRAATVLRALGNERRRAVVRHLARGERSVGELERLVGIGQSALSQHLARLRHAGLVRARRDGRVVYYALERGEANRIIGVLGALFFQPAPFLVPTAGVANRLAGAPVCLDNRLGD
jgi:DNA-binding transcriptional ArsR family regulator